MPNQSLMLRYRQPHTLQSVLYSHFLKLPSQMVESLSIKNVLIKLRREGLLSTTVRFHLLKLEMYGYPVEYNRSESPYPTSLFFIQVLASAGIEYLWVQSFLPLFFEEFLQCLLRNTEKLKTLILRSFVMKTYRESTTNELLTELIVIG